jgi:hypothetical protein
MNQVTILSLTYAINFHDADDGDTYAGDGQRILSAHLDEAKAKEIASEFNPIITQAEKETTVFPVQKFNRALKDRFGFILDDMRDGYGFKLTTETFEVEQ